MTMTGKHATRMVLIPEEEYIVLKENKKQCDCSKVLMKAPKRKTVESRRKFHVLPKKKRLDVKNYFSPEHHPKIDALMQKLNEAGHTVTDDNELNINQVGILPGSNIASLIKELFTGGAAVSSQTQPTGWKIFLKAIADTSLPLTMFPKPAHRSRLSKMRQGTLPWTDY